METQPHEHAEADECATRFCAVQLNMPYPRGPAPENHHPAPTLDPGLQPCHTSFPSTSVSPEPMKTRTYDMAHDSVAAAASWESGAIQQAAEHLPLLRQQIYVAHRYPETEAVNAKQHNSLLHTLEKREAIAQLSNGVAHQDMQLASYAGGGVMGYQSTLHDIHVQIPYF
jgi:hypothetical protein